MYRTNTLIALCSMLELGSIVSAQFRARELFYKPPSVSNQGAQGNGSAQASSGKDEKLNPSVDKSGQRNAGLMFWVELRRQSGQTERVSPSRKFYSGERVRLHVQSNVDGRLVILQKQDGELPELLFPHEKIRNGNGEIHAGEDVTIPSATTFLKFDDNPGKVTLFAMLTERQGQKSDSDASGTSPAALSAPNVANQLLEQAKAASRSKGLAFDSVDSGPEVATYVVNPTKARTGSNKGVVAAEIGLDHRARQSN